MKRIVKGNDFTLRIPVMKMVDGNKVPFPLPACTDIVVRVTNSFKRFDLKYTIDVSNDNIIIARVEGDSISLGTYAVEVKGKIFGNDWRSNEYPQFQIVNKNADADCEFGETDDGDNSVEMDTALVILPPTVELSSLISDTNKALKEVKATDEILQANEAVRVASENKRVSEEQSRIDSELKRSEAETSRTDAESGRESAEQEREKFESKREADENVRTKAEALRVDSEKSRELSEDDRSQSENVRVNAEAVRQLDETLRAQAEKSREKAEMFRVTTENSRTEAEDSRVEAEKQRNVAFAKAKEDCEAATREANNATELCKQAVSKIKYDPGSYSIIINTED